MKPQRLGLCRALLGACMVIGLAGAPAPAADLPRLRAEGNRLVNPEGQHTRLWGVNMVSPFLPHDEAAAVARNLASLGVNVVRHHHLLRPSADWLVRTPVKALSRYDTDSRQPDTEAWDRFDYLNAELRTCGIYLMLAGRFSRLYLPGDVAILTTTEDDAAAWVDAMGELNRWNWRKAIDARKLLPLIDPRVAVLDEEFLRQMLTHVNPYTGLSYATDTQVVTLEVINEFSCLYTLVCGNRLPDYWQHRLEERWRAFAAERDIAPGADLYKPRGAAEVAARTAFCVGLDSARLERIRSVARAAGFQGLITYSNLWRGEDALQMHARAADYIEDHAYVNPLVVDQAADFTAALARSAAAGKPLIVGELNQSEGTAKIAREGPYRTMLMLATAAYGSFHDWAGVVWFAWQHGDRQVGSDGWAISEGRNPAIGDMQSDGMMIDHLPTAGLLFRQAMVESSAQPVVITVGPPPSADDYNRLMAPSVEPQPGWTNVHSFRKATVDHAANASTAWQTERPGSPLVSDTGQIVKDLTRRQLTVTAEAAEAFSGFLDGQPPAGLRHLTMADATGFATVIVVAPDQRPLTEATRLLISRTLLTADGALRDAGRTVLRGLKAPGPDRRWQARLLRPRQAALALHNFAGIEWVDLPHADNESVSLPAAGWNLCEMRLTGERSATRRADPQ